MTTPTAPDNQGEPIIRVEGLTAGYDDFVLMKDVTFDVRRGEVFVILGGSGCGKSTLLKHMSGLYEPMAGHVGGTEAGCGFDSTQPVGQRGRASRDPGLTDGAHPVHRFLYQRELGADRSALHRRERRHLTHAAGDTGAGAHASG